MRNHENYPLISRIAVYTFVFACLVSFLVAAVHLRVTFVEEENKIIELLDQLETNQLEILVNSVWNVESSAVEIQLQSILEHPDIVYIRLTLEGSPEEFLEYGNKPPEPSSILAKEYDLVKDFESKSYVLGRVNFVATTENISSRLLLLTSKYLVAELITVAVTCLFMLVLFIYFYSRHINKIVSYTQNLDIGQLGQELILQRSSKRKHSDEIDRIVEALNTLRIRLKDKIHAQNLIENQLFEEKQFSDTIINNLPGIFFVINEPRRVVKCNRSYLQFYHITEDALSEHNYLASIMKEQKDEVLKAIHALFTRGEAILLEITVTGGDGIPTPFLVTAQLFEQGYKRYLVGVGSDLTLQKRLETQFRQVQKMEALGTLAGGISHDFNNILTAIAGYTNLARLESSGNAKLEKYLETVADASDRAKALVQQILSFSRKTDSEPKPVQISTIVEEAIQLLRSSLPATIEIQQDIRSDLRVVIDSTEMHQVVMNLSTNAYHSMQENGGTLSVKVFERVVSLLDLSPDLDLIPGVYLTIEISDTGQGMDEETKTKIFEPYFTTKEAGVGTGLGLAVVLGIVTKYKGFIDVRSAPDNGATFSIYLPAVMDEKTDISVGNLPSQEIPRGQGQHILVVDDEPMLLEFYEDVLNRYGYQVTSYLDSVDALIHFQDNPDKYTLIILDQMMPKMKGDQLADKIWDTRGAIPIILCSGFSGALGRHEFIVKGFSEYLQKPVTARLLLEAMDNIINP